MIYDYEESKKRIDKILQDHSEAKIVKVIPKNNEFNAGECYYGKVTSIFVDIRKSTKLFSNSKKTSTARTIKCFTSEIIEILYNETNLREIGVRGDCVYAIYSAPNKTDDLGIFNKAIYINTFLKMLNKTLTQKQMKNIKAGIGIATHEDLVIEAGNENVDVYSKVWIGQGVTYASKLSNSANNKKRKPILVTSEFYNNINEILPDKYKKMPKCGFESYNIQQFGNFYGCDFYDEEFNNWIEGGMK